MEDTYLVCSEFDLDLTYITENIIAMAFPGGAIFWWFSALDEDFLQLSDTIGVCFIEGMEATYRNDIKQVSKFFKQRHADHFLIFNLSQRKYDYSRFNNNVFEFGFPDHHSPPLDMLLSICKCIDSWLRADPKNVVAVHCLAGKGRTGTVISCYLNYSGLFDSAVDALEYFQDKRVKQDVGVSIPSQKRYVKYFTDILNGVETIQGQSTSRFLKAVVINDPPACSKKVPLRPLILIYENDSLVFSSNYQNTSSPADKSSTPLSPTSGVFYVPVNVNVSGDILVTMHHLSGRRRKEVQLMRAAFHTSFVKSGFLRLSKSEVDLANVDDRFSAEFFVDVMFQETLKVDAPPSPMSEGSAVSPSIDRAPCLWGSTLSQLSDPIQFSAQPTFIAHSPESIDCLCGDDDDMLYAGGKDGSISLWSLAASESQPSMLFSQSCHQGSITRILMTEDGMLLTGGEDNMLCGWSLYLDDDTFLPSLQRKFQVALLQSPFVSFEMSDSGVFVVISQTEVMRVYINNETGEVYPMWVLRNELNAGTYTAVEVVRSDVAIGLSDGSVLILNVENGGHRVILTGHTAAISCLASYREVLYSASLDHQIRAWHLQDASSFQVYEGHRKGVTNLCMLDGVLYSVGLDNRFLTWDIRNGLISCDMPLTEGVEKFEILQEKLVASSANNIILHNGKKTSEIARSNTTAVTLS